MKKKGIMTVTNCNAVRYQEATDLFFCDPCYVITHTIDYLDQAWGDFCSLMFDKKNEHDYSKEGTAFIETPNGTAQFLYASTAYGDGCYNVRTPFKQDGYEAGVDAGMLSVWTLADVKKIHPDWTDEQLRYYGVVIRGFHGHVNPDEEGNWHGIECCTDGSDEEEEYECDRCGCEVDEYETYCWSCEEYMEDEEGDEDGW